LFLCCLTNPSFIICIWSRPHTFVSAFSRFLGYLIKWVPFQLLCKNVWALHLWFWCCSGI
jgi:hypothetical protein